MRRINRATAEEEAQIDLTPMLDVVFIMLIFFIVTASFVKESGIEINRPEASTSQAKPRASILVAINDLGEIWINANTGEGINVNQALIDEGHARWYMGGSKDEMGEWTVDTGCSHNCKGKKMTRLFLSSLLFLYLHRPKGKHMVGVFIYTVVKSM